MIHTTAKVPEGTNRNFPARNMLVQLLALCTDPESHNAQRYRWMDDMMTITKIMVFARSEPELKKLGCCCDSNCTVPLQTIVQPGYGQYEYLLIYKLHILDDKF